MNELTVQQTSLPASIEDLSKFVLVGREKLVSVRAEIRAIDKLQLAEDVRNQKREEAQMLSEALLDAEVRLGDLLKQIPKDVGGRPLQSKTTDSGVHSFVRPKKEVIQDLGFSEKQAQRFETLADNKDLVEQVKAEARENDDLATRSRVLDLAKVRREQAQEYYKKVDLGAEYFKKLNKAITAINDLDNSNEALSALFETYDDVVTVSGQLRDIQDAIFILQYIQKFLERRASSAK